MNDLKVTMIVFAYNQRHYVDAAVAAALAQDYEPLEILLSDDGSSDGTFERLQELASAYSGRHSVRVRRTAINRGVANHVTQAVREATGDLIVAAAGDDISLPGRVSALVQRWEKLGRGPVVVYSDVETTDEHGAPVDLGGKFHAGELSLQGVAEGRVDALGASTAFTRDLIEAFPPMALDVIHEDRVLPWRALLLGGSVSYLDRPLVKYRTSGGISRRVAKSLKDYLYDWSRHKNQLILPDARQRLADLISVGGPAYLERICKSTIRGHEARIEMATVPWYKLEPCLLKYLWKGAQPAPLVSHYLKFRLRPLIARLARARNPHWTS